MTLEFIPQESYKASADQAKKILSKLSKELGFVTRGALVAFVNFRVRKDDQVTIIVGQKKYD